MLSRRRCQLVCTKFLSSVIYLATRGITQDLHRETFSYSILPSREHHWIWRFGTDTNPSLTHMLIQQVADSGKKTSGRMSKHLFCAT